jgi:hypothetical protein
MASSNPFAAADLSDVQVQLDATGAQLNAKPGNAGSDNERSSTAKQDPTAGGLNPMEIETEETSGSGALTLLVGNLVKRMCTCTLVHHRISGPAAEGSKCTQDGLGPSGTSACSPQTPPGKDVVTLI